MSLPIARRLLATAFAGIALWSITPARAQDVLGSTGITGAGSTFAFPVISQWSRQYREGDTVGGITVFAGSGLDSPSASTALDYESVGSLAGTQRVRQGAVDFGASDVPLRSDELTKLGLGQFPIVIGGVAVVVNLDGVAPGQLKLTGPLLADIYLGKIDSWSDPAIKTLNPELKLPDAKIAVVRRSDGSGTTYNFTDYLSRVSARWKEKVGADLAVSWPTGAGAKGNTGVAQAVKQTRHAIGYVEYSVALQSKLSFAQLQNQSGRFIAPAPASFQAAAASAKWTSASDFDLLLNDAPGEGAYPLVATVYVLMPKSASASRTTRTLDFFQWSLDQGAPEAARLGYVPLPAPLVKQVKAYWASRYKYGL